MIFFLSTSVLRDLNSKQANSRLLQISNLIDWEPIRRVLDEMYDNSVDCIVWIDDNKF